MQPSTLDALVEVLDRDRDRFMEWHDGPSLHEVDSAMERLSREDRARASAIVAERMGKGYNPYLGRAAELLGTEECLASLYRVLGSNPDIRTASNAASNILYLGRSADAVGVFKRIIADRSLFWGDRINALVDLKIALNAAGERRPMSDVITPDLAEVIFQAVSDEDYLVRYHAAEALLKASGNRTELSEHRELFPLICGKRGIDRKPDSADREGFRKAAVLLKGLLRF